MLLKNSYLYGYMMSKGNDLHNLWKSFLFWNFCFGDATDVDVTDCYACQYMLMHVFISKTTWHVKTVVLKHLLPSKKGKQSAVCCSSSSLNWPQWFRHRCESSISSIYHSEEIELISLTVHQEGDLFIRQWLVPNLVSPCIEAVSDIPHRVIFHCHCR